MSHSDVLKQLFPIELGGVFDDDAAIEGKYLDEVQTSAETLLREMHPDQAYETITDWEREYGLTPEADAPLQSRRDAIVKKRRELGGLSRAYFIALAASIGWEITIEEPQPFMAGVSRCGDRVYAQGVVWIWIVTTQSRPYYSFRAGVSCAGERLGWNPGDSALETLLNELKPAHTFIVFNYD